MHTSTKHFFKAGVQLGPWRITRKVLTFIIAFCLFIIAFGCVVLKYHMFDRERDWFSDEDDSSEALDDDDDEDGKSVSGGDVLMLVLMVAAGAVILWSSALCFLSNHNVPNFLDSSDSTIYSIQYEKNPRRTRSAPGGQGPLGGGLRGGQGARSPRSAREAMTGRTGPYTISNGTYPGTHPQNNNNNNTTPYAPSHNGPPSPYCPPYYPAPPPSYPSQFCAKNPHPPLSNAPSAPPPPLSPADLPPPYAP